MNQDWYAIHTKPKPHEWMRAQLNLRNQGLDVLAPLEQFHTRKRARLNDRGEVIKESGPKVSYRPLFPRYLFASFDSEFFGRVAHTLGVQEVVGQRLVGEPIPVDAAFIAELRVRIDGRGVLDFDSLTEGQFGFVPGQSVQVTRGAWAGFSGVFDRALTGDQRVRILLNGLFGDPSIVVPANCISATDVA